MVFEDNQLSSISENKNIETIQNPNSIIEVSSDKSSVEEESTNDGFIITSVKQTAETDNTILSEGDQPNQYVEGTNTWTGTVSEAEEQFTTNTVNGIDIVKDVNSQVPFTGKMQILNKNGSILGEVNLLDGKLHGEEIILDDTGIIVERYLWNKGVELK